MFCRLENATDYIAYDDAKQQGKLNQVVEMKFEPLENNKFELMIAMTEWQEMTNLKKLFFVNATFNPRVAFKGDFKLESLEEIELKNCTVDNVAAFNDLLNHVPNIDNQSGKCSVILDKISQHVDFMSEDDHIENFTSLLNRIKKIQDMHSRNVFNTGTTTLSANSFDHEEDEESYEDDFEDHEDYEDDEGVEHSENEDDNDLASTTTSPLSAKSPVQKFVHEESDDFDSQSDTSSQSNSSRLIGAPVRNTQPKTPINDSESVADSVEITRKYDPEFESIDGSEHEFNSQKESSVTYTGDDGISKSMTLAEFLTDSDLSTIEKKITEITVDAKGLDSNLLNQEFTKRLNQFSNLKKLKISNATLDGFVINPGNRPELLKLNELAIDHCFVDAQGAGIGYFLNNGLDTAPRVSLDAVEIDEAVSLEDLYQILTAAYPHIALENFNPNQVEGRDDIFNQDNNSDASISTRDRNVSLSGSVANSLNDDLDMDHLLSDADVDEVQAFVDKVPQDKNNVTIQVTYSGNTGKRQMNLTEFNQTDRKNIVSLIIIGGGKDSSDMMSAINWNNLGRLETLTIKDATLSGKLKNSMFAENQGFSSLQTININRCGIKPDSIEGFYRAGADALSVLEIKDSSGVSEGGKWKNLTESEKQRISKIQTQITQENTAPNLDEFSSVYTKNSTANQQQVSDLFTAEEFDDYRTFLDSEDAEPLPTSNANLTKTAAPQGRSSTAPSVASMSSPAARSDSTKRHSGAKSARMPWDASSTKAESEDADQGDKLLPASNASRTETAVPQGRSSTAPSVASMSSPAARSDSAKQRSGAKSSRMHRYASSNKAQAKEANAIDNQSTQSSRDSTYGAEHVSMFSSKKSVLAHSQLSKDSINQFRPELEVANEAGSERTLEQIREAVDQAVNDTIKDDKYRKSYKTKIDFTGDCVKLNYLQTSEKTIPLLDVSSDSVKVHRAWRNVVDKGDRKLSLDQKADMVLISLGMPPYPPDIDIKGNPESKFVIKIRQVFEAKKAAYEKEHGDEPDIVVTKLKN